MTDETAEDPKTPNEDADGPSSHDTPEGAMDPMGAPPVYDEVVDDKVSIDVEGRFPEIRRLKATGAILLILAGLTAVLPMFLLGDGLGSGLPSIIAISLAVAGIVVGVAGLYAPTLRGPGTMVGPTLLIAAAATGTLGAALDDIPLAELLLAFVFGASWLLAVEHMHAVTRFVELGAYVTRQRLTTFSLGGVVNHFQVYGIGLIGIIAVVTAVVVIGVPWVFAAGSSGTFARSVELNSVFGIALAAAVVFTLSALILVFIRSVMPQRVEVEKVAYSRDTLEDMLRSSKLIEMTDEQAR